MPASRLSGRAYACDRRLSRPGAEGHAGKEICGVIKAEALVKMAEWYMKLETIDGPWDCKAWVLENHVLELED
jgi:hypothetical protein